MGYNYNPWSFEKGNYGPFQIWDLSILFEWAPSKLSENHKLVEFGPSEL